MSRENMAVIAHQMYCKTSVFSSFWKKVEAGDIPEYKPMLPPKPTAPKPIELQDPFPAAHFFVYNFVEKDMPEFEVNIRIQQFFQQ